nr:ABC transporter permease [Lachnospiraceae bacterium]
MLKFIVKRILISIPIFLCITFAVFVLSNLAPGSPADVIAQAGNLTEEAYRQLEISLGLDKPIYVRYAIWLGDLLKGYFGNSTTLYAPVSYLIQKRIGPSLLLTGTSIVLATLLAIPLGVIAACKPYSAWDNASSVVSFLGVSLPSFFLCLVGIYVFSVKLAILPASGMHNPGDESLGDLLRHLLLPSLIVCVLNMGSIVKQTRGAVLEVLGEDYIKTARSKGLKEKVVIIKHALRNALIPIVTTIGMLVPMLVGGAVVTEQCFGWPGMGSLMINAISTRDYNTIMGCTVVISVSVLVVNLLLDILYTYLDPRIKKG